MLCAQSKRGELCFLTEFDPIQSFSNLLFLLLSCMPIRQYSQSYIWSIMYMYTYFSTLPLRLRFLCGGMKPQLCLVPFPWGYSLIRGKLRDVVIHG